MTYARAEMLGGPVLNYPFTLEMLRKSLPNVSFPRKPSDARMEAFGIFKVHPTTPPTPALTEDVVEVTPVWNGSQLEQAWALQPASAEDIADRLKEQSDEQDKLSIKADTFVQTFIAMTPAEVDSYIDVNVTNLASAKAVLNKLALMVLLLARREFEG